LLFAAVLVAAGCGEAAPEPGANKVDRQDDQLAKAQDEGEVTWYAGLEQGLVDKIAAGFEKKTGISVDAIRLGGEEASTRLLQENDAGVHLADVVYTGNEGNFVDFKKRGLLAPYRSAEVSHFDKAYYDEDLTYYVPYANRFWMVYNTNLVPESEVPKGYADLADPKWSGALAISHPGYSVGAAIVPFFWSQTDGLGLDLMDKIAANKPLINQSVHDSMAAVISGERKIAVVVNDAGFYTDGKGAPVKAIYPAEGVPTSGGGVGVAKQAPHPYAARELLDYIMSQEGQQIMADESRTVFRDDVKYPTGYVPPTSGDQNLYVVDPAKFAAEHDEIVAHFQKVFGV
jgi:iron(III) transport system substrate-binding protein